jgi:hypothetical protein
VGTRDEIWRYLVHVSAIGQNLGTVSLLAQFTAPGCALKVKKQNPF